MTPPNEHDLISLQDLLRGRLSTARLAEWAAASAGREKLLQNSIWGIIEWPRELGLPVTPTRAAAFAIKHTSYWMKLYVGPGGVVIKKDGWAVLDPFEITRVRYEP